MTVRINIAEYNLLYFTQSFGDTTESLVFPTNYSFVPTKIITIVGLRLEQLYIYTGDTMKNDPRRAYVKSGDVGRGGGWVKAMVCTLPPTLGVYSPRDP